MKNFLTRARARFLAAVAAFGMASVALAEGESNITYSNIDLSGIVDALKTWLGTATPWILGVLAAFLGVSLIFTAFKWIKGASKQGK